jgi:hypothetical protein
MPASVRNLPALLAALSSDSARVRYGAAKKLQALSARSPELLYPHFEVFAGLLHGENRILRWNAMRILGYLAPADTGGRLDRMIGDYLSPIPGPHLIDAANAMRGAAAIAVVKPHLAETVARHILQVEHAVYATPECRNVAIGHSIDCLARIFPLIAGKRAVQLFISRQLENSRPAVRKRAERFLRKWPLAADAKRAD